MLNANHGMACKSLNEIKQISLENPNKLIPIPLSHSKSFFIVALAGIFGMPKIKEGKLLSVVFGEFTMIPSQKNKKEIENFMEENNLATH